MIDMLETTEMTREDLGIAGLVMYQPRKGYRFTVDAVLLGTLAPIKPGFKIADFGCGSGILLLLLKGREPMLSLTGIELEEATAELARCNMEQNGISARIISGNAMDAAELLSSEEKSSFDLIISNPPYYKVNECRLPEDKAMALAKTELAWDRNCFMEQASLLLKTGGVLSVILPPKAIDELKEIGYKTGLVLAEVINIKKDDGSIFRKYAEFIKTDGPFCRDIFIKRDVLMDSEEYKGLLGIYNGAWTVSGGHSGGKS